MRRESYNFSARWMTTGALLLAACGFTQAKVVSAKVQADNVALGSASVDVAVTPKDGGHIAWKLSAGAFAPATLADGKVIWDAASLSGAGDAAQGKTVVLKEFNVTVEQSTGVDVSYRFRLSITLSGADVTGLAIEQLK